MSSPFTTTQSELLQAGAGIVVLLAGWQLWQLLRSCSRGTTPTRLLPFVAVMIMLALAFFVVMFVEAPDFSVRHIGWMALPLVIAFVAIIFAATCDEKHRVITGPEKPSRVDLFRYHLADVLKTGEPQFPQSRTSLLLNHLKNLARFYVGAERLRIVSTFNFDRAMSRIKHLPDAGEVWVRENPPKKLMVCCTHRVRENIFPVFRGTLTELDGKAVLDGQIAMDTGIIVVGGLIMFCALVVVPLNSLFNPGPAPSDRWTGMLGVMVGYVLLEWIYLASRERPAIIIRNLECALQDGLDGNSAGNASSDENRI